MSNDVEKISKEKTRLFKIAEKAYKKIPEYVLAVKLEKMRTDLNKEVDKLLAVAKKKGDKLPEYKRYSE